MIRSKCSRHVRRMVPSPHIRYTYVVTLLIRYTYVTRMLADHVSRRRRHRRRRLQAAHETARQKRGASCRPRVPPEECAARVCRRRAMARSLDCWDVQMAAARTPFAPPSPPAQRESSPGPQLASPLAHAISPPALTNQRCSAVGRGVRLRMRRIREPFRRLGLGVTASARPRSGAPAAAGSGSGRGRGRGCLLGQTLSSSGRRVGSGDDSR